MSFQSWPSSALLLTFCEKKPLEIEYNAECTICKKYFGLDWYNNHKEEVIKEPTNKNNKKKTLKHKAKQIKKKKN